MIYIVVNAVPPLVRSAHQDSVAGDAFLSQPAAGCVNWDQG